MIDADQVDKISSNAIITQAEQVRSDAFDLLKGGDWNVSKVEENTPIDLSVIILLIKSSRRSYSDLEDYLA